MSRLAAWPLPTNTAPTGERCLQVTIPDDDDYEMLLISAVAALSFWDAYDRDSAHSGRLVANVFKKVMETWTDCAGNPVASLGQIVEDAMPLHVDCDCNVTVDCCDGTTKQLATVDMLNKPTQPGKGSAQPVAGGGTQCYDLVLDADKKWFIPAPLNTGDVVKVGLPIGTFTEGSTNDGTNAELYCENGSRYYAGDCNTSGAHTVSTDPLNTSPHMTMLLVISGVYYLIADSTFTVPSGVVNQNAYIQLNTDNLGICSGSLTGKVCVTNNQTAHGCHTFDFTLSDGGWVVDTGVCSDNLTAQYVPGVGWQTHLCPDHNQAFLTISKFVALPTITSIRAVYQISSSPAAQAEIDVFPSLYGTIPGSVGAQDATVTSTVSGGTGIRFVLAWGGGSGAIPATLSKIVVCFNGADPF